MLPELNGKLDGYAIRVPTINVSIVDPLRAKRDTTVEEVNSILKAASEGELKGILTTTPSPWFRWTTTTTRPPAPSTRR